MSDRRSCGHGRVRSALGGNAPRHEAVADSLLGRVQTGQPIVILSDSGGAATAIYHYIHAPSTTPCTRMEYVEERFQAQLLRTQVKYVVVGAYLEYSLTCLLAGEPTCRGTVAHD